MSIKALSAASLALLLASNTYASDLDRLLGLLASTPEGGWVKANTNSFESAWPTGAATAPIVPGSPSGPGAVVRAWSGFAWDSNRSDIVIYGGGHANYLGNEVYVWGGGDGAWTRGTLPSRVGIDASDLSTYSYVVGDGAPQAAHTYQSNIYVPLNDRFVTYGGGGWYSGAPLLNSAGEMTGPWWWDPSKADANKVGGQDGTGWNPASLGSNSWEARPKGPFSGPVSPTSGPPLVYSSSSTYRQENGKDVIYSFLNLNGSGFMSLWRYQLGSPGDASTDSWAQVGQAQNSVSSEGTSAFDSNRNLLARTGINYAGYTNDLLVFDLTKNNAANPFANKEIGVKLLKADGSDFDFAQGASIQFDSVNDEFVIWDSFAGGTVWVTKPQYLADGSLAKEWTIVSLASTTAAQPVGDHLRGVLGKWKYVDELGAFIAMDNIDEGGNADIWLYKPLAAVAEPQTWLLFGLGLAAVARCYKRKS